MEKTRFEWDGNKDAINQQKHGVCFADAQYAFADPRRLVVTDEEHGGAEERWYCLGRQGGGILSSASSERDIGERGNESMKSRIKYTDEPMEKVRVVDDFLPPPEQLAFKEETVKVTLALSTASVAFFKAQAKQHGTAYQAMIRRLLDSYAVKHAR